jgi:Ca2+-transporting ATPase
MVAEFRAAGVRPVMITGDHEATARAVAEAVGIADEPDRPAIFARVRPDGKRSIVRELRSGGEVVAMTGDGVNDAPALRAADVGVSMGPRATEVARQAADIVLTADDLSTMAFGIAEGRRCYDNIRTFLHYALGGGLAEVIVMMAGVGLSFAVPLQAGQLLWTNLLTHGLPGVAMGNEPAAADVLTRPPRSPGLGLLDRSIALRVLALGLGIGVVTLGTGVWARHEGGPWQSVMFVTLTLAQLLAALALSRRGADGAANRLLLGAVALNLGLVYAAVGWAPLRTLLHTRPLSVVEWTVCLSAALLPAVIAKRQRDRLGRGPLSA